MIIPPNRTDPIVENGVPVIRFSDVLEELVNTVNTVVSNTDEYTPTNVTTDRAFDADAAANGAGIDVADVGPADVALLSDHDALVAVVQELADIVGTLIEDLQSARVIP